MQTILHFKWRIADILCGRKHLYHKAVADISGGEVLGCFVDGKVFARQGGQVGIFTLTQRGEFIRIGRD